jgi:hypothetical protein
MRTERKYTSNYRVDDTTTADVGNHINALPGNSTRSSGGLRSRYHRFLEKNSAQESPSEGSRVGQEAINIAIFCALVVVILTAIGIGLSWFGGAQKETSVQSGQSGGPQSPTGLSQPPAQPAGPAGHADFRSQSSVDKKPDGK